MNEEELSVKQCLLLNKLRFLEENLQNLLNKEIIELMKVVNDKPVVNAISMNAVFNLLTSIIASDIHNSLVDPYVIQKLMEDFPIQVHRKLELLKERLNNYDL